MTSADENTKRAAIIFVAIYSLALVTMFVLKGPFAAIYVMVVSASSMSCLCMIVFGVIGIRRFGQSRQELWW